MPLERNFLTPGFMSLLSIRQKIWNFPSLRHVFIGTDFLPLLLKTDPQREKPHESLACLPWSRARSSTLSRQTELGLEEWYRNVSGGVALRSSGMGCAPQCLTDKAVWNNFILWCLLPGYFIKMCLGHTKECCSGYWRLLFVTPVHVPLCHWAGSLNTCCLYHCVSYFDFRSECCPGQVEYILCIWIQVPLNQNLMRIVNPGF